jgi:hypothetical protein
MPRYWRLLLVALMLTSVAPVSAARLAFVGHESTCPYARAEAVAASTNAAPFLGLKHKSSWALMP